MKLRDFSQMIAQLRDKRLRHDGGPVLVTFPGAHRNRAQIKVHIFDPESHTFIDPESCTVNQLSHQAGCAFHSGKGGFNFLVRHHHGNGLVTPDAAKLVQIGHRCAEDFPVQEGDRIERRGLGVGRDRAHIGHVIQVGLDLLLTHIGRVAFVVKQDVLADPEDIGLGCFRAEMFLTAGNMDLIYETWFLWRGVLTP